MNFIDNLKNKINFTKSAIKILLGSYKITPSIQNPYEDKSITAEIPKYMEEDLDLIIQEVLAEEVDSNGKEEEAVEVDSWDLPMQEELISESSDDWDLPEVKNDPANGFFVPGDLPSSEPTVPPVVFGLDTEISPDFQAAILTPQPIEAGPSILDNKIADLEAMDIDKLRAQLLHEVKALELANPEYRKVQLQKIFGLLIAMQPNDPLGRNDDRYERQEQRLYADLISTPGLSSIPYVREFLENDFYVTGSKGQYKKDLLNKIYRYYDTHTQESIDKFNYIFRSSDGVSTELINNDINLDDYFSDRVMSSFRKEDLSQMFRFSFYHDSGMQMNLYSLFSKEHEKTLFMVSQMVKVVNDSMGHSSELFESLLYMVSYNNGQNNFVSLLTSVYDEFIESKEDEKAFAEALAKNPDFTVIKELINYVVFSRYDQSLSTGLFKNATTFDTFMAAAKTYRDERHREILGPDGMGKVLDGSFDPSKDFKPVTDNYELDCFKEALLYNLYGISVEEARHLQEHYGKYMDVLMQGIPPKPEGMSEEEFLASLDESQMTIMKKDYATLQMFKAINSIYSLTLTDDQFHEKLDVLRSAYLMHVREKGFDRQMSAASAIVVEGLLNNMFMNSYNKRLLSLKDNHPVLKVDDGITLLDAGVEFDMILTSLSGVGSFFDSTINMASKWNTAALSTGQGICTSHISSQNLGVISLDSPMLGFSSIPGVALNAMGTTDIYTGIYGYNLRTDNDSRQGNNRFFVPGNIMSNETRFGYNEILLDRFMMQDDSGKLKLQPEYLVFFKMSDRDYKFNQVYLQTKKMAKDFGVPIMVVDIPKIKEHERSVIKGMEEELFASSEVDKKLVEDIVTRYMNNYTGSLTITANTSCGWGRVEDFSVDGVKQFFTKAVEKIGSIEDPEVQRQWLEALEHAYRLEKKRYKEAKSVGSWNDSVKRFLLQDIGVKSQLEAVRYDLDHGKASSLDDTLRDIDMDQKETDDPWKTAELPKVVPPEQCPTIQLLDGREGTFVMDEKYTPEVVSIMRLANYMEDGTTFEVVDNYSYENTPGKIVIGNYSEENEVILVENLVASYFLENCEVPPIADIGYSILENGIETSVTEGYDWNKAIMASPYREILVKGGEDTFIPLSPEKVSSYVSKIENMKDEDFVQIFTPLIESTAAKTGESKEVIADRLLTKKASIGAVFNKLQSHVNAINGGEDVVTTGEDSKTRG